MMYPTLPRRNEDTTDDTRCRWPDCDCYSPQGPQNCRGSSCTTAVLADWLERALSDPAFQADGGLI